MDIWSLSASLRNNKKPAFFVMLWDNSVWAMTFLQIPLAMSDLPVYLTTL